MATKIESRLSALELVAEKVAATPPSITVVYMGRDGREVRRVEVPIPANTQPKTDAKLHRYRV